MRAQGLLLALLCLMGFMGYCGSLSTCKPLNLELVKMKRIEAIRGQILSKLRLTKEPDDDEKRETDEVPAEVLSVYNSTVELIQDTVDSPDAEVEAYYAKEVHKFNMTKYTDGSMEMDFNVTEMKAALGCNGSVSQAELRLLIRHTRIPQDKEERLELFQGSQYLTSHFITNKLEGKWISFDVTQTVKDWLKNCSEKTTLKKLVLKLHCWNEKDEMLFQISGMANNRGDTGVLQEKIPKPHILVMSLSKEHHSSRRKRQATGDEVCSEQSDVCCVRKLYIDFRKDLGWKWIHEPSGYYANYCIGSCSFFWNTENKYSQVLALYKHHNPGASAQPCCVPQVLDPLPILYYVGRKYKVEHLSNMIVKTCKCS